MTRPELIQNLRELIFKAAPDPELAVAIKKCSPDEALDSLMPFSSVIILGVVVALEDAFSLRITSEDFKVLAEKEITLSRLALLIEQLQRKSQTSGVAS